MTEMPEDPEVAWRALADAEATWRRLRHRTPEDLERLEAATRAYWTASVHARRRGDPTLRDGDLENEVATRLRELAARVGRSDHEARARIGAGLAAALCGDAAHVVGWARGQPDPAAAAEDLLAACAERGLLDLARWLAPLLHPLAAPGEPREVWVRHALAHLAR